MDPGISNIPVPEALRPYFREEHGRLTDPGTTQLVGIHCQAPTLQSHCYMVNGSFGSGQCGRDCAFKATETHATTGQVLSTRRSNRSDKKTSDNK